MSTNNDKPQGFFSEKAFAVGPLVAGTADSDSISRDHSTDNHSTNEHSGNDDNSANANEKSETEHQDRASDSGISDDTDTIKPVESSGIKQDMPEKTIAKKATLGCDEPLKLAVVGHTNTGKTSILRTLLRDQYFGEVQNSAATTRHVERAMISDNQTEQNLVALFDTPGLEDATGVMDWLDDSTASRRDGIERLQTLLVHDFSASEVGSDSDIYDFSQEIKVIKQLLASDIAVYVIDVREPVLSKYKDELTILSWSATPVMPVFNFIGVTDQDNYLADWQKILARRNLHISTNFDSVAFEFSDEMSLWSNLSTMLTDAKVLEQLIESRQRNWQTLYDEATIIIADFLIDITSYEKKLDVEQETQQLTDMQEVVRQAERVMQSQLLDLYKFYDSNVATTPVNLTQYQQDPFDGDVLKSYGIRTSSGAAAGALVGMGIDVAALGTTLGLGTAIGSLTGGILSNSAKIADAITGTKYLNIDPLTITLLATRSLTLLTTLRHRGHANSGNTIVSDVVANENIHNPVGHVTQVNWTADKLPSILKKVRGRSELSSLHGKNAEQAKLLRLDLAWKLSGLLVVEPDNDYSN